MRYRLLLDFALRRKNVASEPAHAARQYDMRKGGALETWISDYLKALGEFDAGEQFAAEEDQIAEFAETCGQLELA